LIVYNELRIRGYNVYAGTVDNLEIDFVAERGKENFMFRSVISWPMKKLRPGNSAIF